MREINTPEKGEYFFGIINKFSSAAHTSQGHEGILFWHLQSHQFTIMCSPESINCFPVLMNILSNTFLRLFNSTARFRVWSELFYAVRVLPCWAKINWDSWRDEDCTAWKAGWGSRFQGLGGAGSKGWGQWSHCCWFLRVFNDDFSCGFCRVSVL